MERFVEFMDNLLLQRDCVPLDSFCLVSWSNGAHCLNHPRANLWISHALSNKVRVLRIVEYYELFNLDPYPFISVHLKELTLNCVFISALFIENLLSNCPALEDLTMIDSRVLAIKFSSRTLKNLTFISLGPNDDSDVHDDFEDLVIDTPNLVSLHLEDLALLAPCLINVSSVVKASFRLDEECFSSSDANCNILSALSNVTKLKLVSRPDNGTSQETETVSKVLRRDLWRCQAFNNLKSLSVGDWCVDADLSALLYFLRRSPVLKKLTLCLSAAGASGWGHQRHNLKSKKTDMSFNCEHLKTFRIRCARGDKRVHSIVNVILANAISLPEIVINPYEPLYPLE